MKNLRSMSERTKKVSAREGLPLYYSIKEDAVYDEDGEGRFYMTDLIRYNSPEEIEETVKIFLSY